MLITLDLASCLCFGVVGLVLFCCGCIVGDWLVASVCLCLLLWLWLAGDLRVWCFWVGCDGFDVVV